MFYNIFLRSLQCQYVDPLFQRSKAKKGKERITMLFLPLQTMDNEKEIRLKVLVDKNKNRVIFAESDSDFIDVLFCFLTTPIGSIIRLSAEQSLNVGIGCMNHLYKSVENIDVQSFLTAHSKDMLLNPRNGAEAHFKNLKLRIDSGMGANFFFCGTENCQKSSDWMTLLSYFGNLPCKCGRCTDFEVNLLQPYGLASKLPFGANDGGVFVKEMNRYMISDDLQVIPLSSAASIRLLSKCGVTDGSSIEERTFTFGVVEVRQKNKVGEIAPNRTLCG